MHKIIKKHEILETYDESKEILSFYPVLSILFWYLGIRTALYWLDTEKQNLLPSHA